MIPRLVDLPSWTLWRVEPNPEAGKKPLKVPVHWDGHTRHSTMPTRRNPHPQPAAPLDYATAADCVANLADPAVGLGFRPLPEYHIGCLDLDNCIDANGNWSAGAHAIFVMLEGAALERSWSGRGLHWWFTYRGQGWGIMRAKGTALGDLDLFTTGDAFVAMGTYISGTPLVDATDAIESIVATCFAHRNKPSANMAVVEADWGAKTGDQQRATLHDLRAALAFYDPDDREEWVRTGINLSSLGEAGFEIWREWSATSSKWPGGDGCEDRWATFNAQRSDYRSLFAEAKRRGWANGSARLDVSQVGFGQGIELPAGATAVAPPTPVAASQTFMAAASGTIKATPANVTGALLSAESGIEVAYDNFKGQIVIGRPGAWEAFTDTHYMMLRVEMERRGFAQIPPEIIKSSVDYVAQANKIDVAVEWAKSLKWDGVPRVTLAMTSYFGCEDTWYSRAVAEYLFTALAGRCLDPGCQADMALILVGMQGARKTSVISALSPIPEAFCEINLVHKDESLSRLMRGKLVGEIAEMQGLTGRALGATKAFITRRTERWIPKYREFETTFPRRLVMLGSANDAALLDDDTGERRWLPLMCGQTQPEALRRDCEQLWAEGVVMWQASGIAWRRAEELARNEHDAFKVVNSDEAAHSVAVWLETRIPGSAQANGEAPFTMSQVAVGLGIAFDRLDMKAQKRLGKLLHKLGYERRNFRDGQKVVKKWVAK